MQNYLASTLDIQWMPHFIAIQWTAYFSITVNSPPKNFNFHWNFTTNHFFFFQVKDRNSAKVRWSICPSPAVGRLVKRKANGMPERSARTPTRCRCKWGCRPQWPLVFGRCGYVIEIQSFWDDATESVVPIYWYIQCITLPTDHFSSLSSLQVSTKQQGQKHIKSFDLKNNIYVLFNPWSRGKRLPMEIICFFLYTLYNIQTNNLLK